MNFSKWNADDVFKITQVLRSHLEDMLEWGQWFIFSRKIGATYPSLTLYLGIEYSPIVITNLVFTSLFLGSSFGRHLEKGRGYDLCFREWLS